MRGCSPIRADGGGHHWLRQPAGSGWGRPGAARGSDARYRPAVQFDLPAGGVRAAEHRVLDTTAKVPGLDGEKMSKSYGNTVEIFEEPKKLRKKIMSIKTDSRSVEDPRIPRPARCSRCSSCSRPKKSRGPWRPAIGRAAWDMARRSRRSLRKRMRILLRPASGGQTSRPAGRCARDSCERSGEGASEVP